MSKGKTDKKLELNASIIAAGLLADGMDHDEVAETAVELALDIRAKVAYPNEELEEEEDELEEEEAEVEETEEEEAEPKEEAPEEDEEEDK